MSRKQILVQVENTGHKKKFLKTAKFISTYFEKYNSILAQCSLFKIDDFDRCYILYKQYFIQIVTELYEYNKPNYL